MKDFLKSGVTGMVIGCIIYLCAASSIGWLQKEPVTVHDTVFVSADELMHYDYKVLDKIGKERCKEYYNLTEQTDVIGDTVFTDKWYIMQDKGVHVPVNVTSSVLQDAIVQGYTIYTNYDSCLAACAMRNDYRMGADY